MNPVEIPRMCGVDINVRRGRRRKEDNIKHINYTYAV